MWKVEGSPEDCAVGVDEDVLIENKLSHKIGGLFDVDNFRQVVENSGQVVEDSGQEGLMREVPTVEIVEREKLQGDEPDAEPVHAEIENSMQSGLFFPKSP